MNVEVALEGRYCHADRGMSLATQDVTPVAKVVVEERLGYAMTALYERTPHSKSNPMIQTHLLWSCQGASWF